MRNASAEIRRREPVLKNSRGALGVRVGPGPSPPPSPPPCPPCLSAAPKLGLGLAHSTSWRRTPSLLRSLRCKSRKAHVRLPANTAAQRRKRNLKDRVGEHAEGFTGLRYCVLFAMPILAAFVHVRGSRVRLKARIVGIGADCAPGGVRAWTFHITALVM